MFYTAGGFTLDDTVLPSGEVRWRAPGGNALYSALGARIWAEDVGIIAPIGRDYPESHLERLREAGFNLNGVTRVDHPSFHVWVLHGGEAQRQIIYRLDSGKNEFLDPKPEDLPRDCLEAEGVHICPIMGSSQAALMDALFEHGTPTFLDLIVIPEQIDIHAGPARDMWSSLRGFLPSIEEARAIWGDLEPALLAQKILEVNADAFGLKLGGKGSLVGSRGGSIFHIPAVDTDVVDSTGAGDAYCGGYMVGLQQTGDPVEAGLRGTVSASFVIEDFGALHALQIDQEEAHRRLRELREATERFVVEPTEH